ncbi:DUF3024 domain-containing protein [Microbulbifer elongatus]|uniref:DUF3024 domain-containing protein n=1 Tax=Microbulbifer elongatus TaxID=86173 RepID=A0ABT1P2M6_9GAMM|nr:DUF3024 domain-containing protein [Microbulbifer elongatus]MCQ3829244.1 DUF3024 domain-containing protein [Microbulbifer elongatus]
MALSEFELKKCEKALDNFLSLRRPPAHIRDEVDLQYRIENQSVVIFEVRPEWQDPSRKMEIPVAKATFVKRQKIWKVCWQRQDLKWHSYPPDPEVKSIEDFVAIVDEDANCCFFG